MIPFIAPLLLKLSPVGRILKAVPRQVWVALAIAAIIGAGWLLHAHSVKKAYRTGYSEGVAAEGLRIARKAEAIKRKADQASAKISQALKDQNDAQNRAIAGSADTLRLHGPGKAACTSHPSLPASPGGSVAASGQGSVAGPEVPPADLAAVPWGWLIGSAERCDLNRAEVLAWREWYRQQSEAWAKIK